MINHPLSKIFEDSRASVPVTLRRIGTAKVIWLNERVISKDPNFAKSGYSRLEYCNLLTSKCGFASDIVDDGEPATGFADRYGGAGIGANGGSGRSVYLDDYYIKGVGPTPLIGHGSSTSHSSGGAYLEEAAREAIFGEVFHSQVPWGTVPILAIIDLGVEQIWPTGYEPARERRVLIVRPKFLRPAHFERAFYFNPSNQMEKLHDFERVSFLANEVIAIVGVSTFADFVQKTYCRWAEQVAFGFAHGLVLGGYSSSNVSINGELVDFGAATMVAPFLNVFTSINGGPIEDRRSLIVSLEHMRASLFKVLSYKHFQRFDFALLKRGIDEVYKMTLVRGLFSHCGLEDGDIHVLINTAGRDACVALMDRFLRSTLRTRYDLESNDVHAINEIEFGSVWNESSRPAFLTRIFEFLLNWCQDADVARFMANTIRLSGRQRLRSRFDVRADLLKSLSRVDNTNASQLLSEVIGSATRNGISSCFQLPRVVQHDMS